MGLPVPDPPEDYGNNCTSCTPARWASGETPQWIYCMFWDIVDCGVSSYPAPNGEIFAMEQTAGNPCIWTKGDGVWRPDFVAKVVGTFQSRLRLLDKDGFGFFVDFHIQCPLEYHIYNNDQGACILAYAGSEGHGTIWWNSKITTIIESLGLRAGSDLFYELFRGTSDEIVHKFCDEYQRTNLKIQQS